MKAQRHIAPVWAATTSDRLIPSDCATSVEVGPVVPDGDGECIRLEMLVCGRGRIGLLEIVQALPDVCEICRRGARDQDRASCGEEVFDPDRGVTRQCFGERENASFGIEVHEQCAFSRGKYASHREGSLSTRVRSTSARIATMKLAMVARSAAV